MLAAAIVLTACGDGKGIVEEPTLFALAADDKPFAEAARALANGDELIQLIVDFVQNPGAQAPPAP